MAQDRRQPARQHAGDLLLNDRKFLSAAGSFRLPYPLVSFLITDLIENRGAAGAGTTPSGWRKFASLR
jgi:hypothetical protein